MDSSNTTLIIALLYALLIGAIAYIRYLFMVRRASKFVRGGTPPLPKIPLSYIDTATLRSKKSYIRAKITEFRDIPWGQSPVDTTEEVQQLYNEGIAIVTQAEGDFGQAALAVEKFVNCTPVLAYSGAAAVMRHISYFGSSDYLPEGIQEAGRYTSLAIASDPSSAEAWIMRVRVFSASKDVVYRRIARYALNQAIQRDPLHPRLAAASALFFQAMGYRRKQESALIAATRTSPTPPERLSAYSRLVTYYLQHFRARKAISTAHNALTEFPQGSAWFWHNYSLAFKAARRYKEALECSDRALTFFEFPRARKTNNQLRAKIGLANQH